MKSNDADPRASPEGGRPQVNTAPAFAGASEAMEVAHAGLRYLAAADATAMAAETQARRLQMLEQADSMGTAARTSILAAFTSSRATPPMRITVRPPG